MGYALLFVVVMATGEGQNFAGKFTSIEACEAALAGIVAKISAHNAKAQKGEEIVYYAAGCTEIREAPKGRDG